MSSSSQRISPRALRQGFSVLAVTGLLITAARAQVDRGWLEDALRRTAQVADPWSSNIEEPPGAASKWGREDAPAVAPEKPFSAAPSLSHEEESGSLRSIESLVRSADALPYPWDDRVEVKNDLVDPWQDRDHTPWVAPEKRVLEDAFVQRAAPSTPDPAPGIKTPSRADLVWDLERPWLHK